MNQFFTAVEGEDFSKAFGIWNNDPNWRDHAQRYAAAGYPYGRLWLIGANPATTAASPATRFSHSTSYGNNTLLAVEINGRKTAPLALGDNKAHTYHELFAF